TAIYNYIMVVKDAEGNYQVPRVQRYRSPYFVGDPSSTASSAFRTEQRWRRASLFLVDEAYQQLNATRLTAQPNPQIMSYVPMDVSGLDHDFFIHKYETQSYSGSISNGVTSNGTSSSTWPLQGSGTNNTWSSKAGACYENFWRTGTISAALCGDGASTNNATSTVVQSKQGVSPVSNIDQGAMWKACNNTGVIDGSGNIYYLNLVSDAEWVKAADWGDVAQQGTVTQSQFGNNIGSNVAALEYTAKVGLSGDTNSTTTITMASTTGAQVGQLIRGSGIPTNTSITAVTTNTSITISAAATATATGVAFSLQAAGPCNSSNPVSGAVPGNSLQTSNCRSRFGLADGPGNLWDWTNGQVYSAVGYDNGVDGLWLQITKATVAGTKYDLLRGLYISANGPTISQNGDSSYYATALRGSARGDYYAGLGGAGRWSLLGDSLSSRIGTFLGGRCTR
ncbi:MAG: hypothetical protein NTX25_07140, partial [Proteobacteria bacterium]|nr:hypothetical protein [Pseudomonadota bacterium]